MKGIEVIINKIRNRLIDTTLLGLSLLMIPPVLISVLRAISFSWNWLYLSHIFTPIAIFLLYMFRRRFSVVHKTFILSFIFIFVGLWGTLCFGTSGGYFMCSFAIVLISIFYGRKAGFLYTVVVMSGLIIVALIYKSNVIERYVDLNEYNNSLVSWLTIILSFSAFLFILVHSIGLFYKYFINTIKELKYKANELELKNQELLNKEIELENQNEILFKLNQQYNKAKESAEENENMLKQISDNFENGMIYQILVDESGNRKFTYLSKNVSTLYGCSIDEVKENPEVLYGKIHKLDYKLLLELERRALETMSVFKAEVRVYKPDGTFRWAYLITKPRKLKGLICLDGIEIDITEQKQADIEREALLIQISTARDEEAKAKNTLNSIMERVSDGFIAFDENFNYTFVNKHGGDLLGRKAEDLIGKNYWDEYPEAKGTPFASAYQQAMITQEPIFFEDYYVHWDRWFVNRIYPSKEGITIFFTDITERKKAELALLKSESQFRAVVENSNDGILFTNENGQILYRSPSYSRLNGYTAEERIGHSVFDTIYPEDREILINTWKQVILFPENEYRLEYRVVHKNGSSRWIESSGQNLLKNTNVKAIVIASRDITVRKKTEEELIAAKEKAEESDRLKSSFLQNMSHEIRTPLNAITGFAQLLTKMDRPTEKITKYVDIITLSSNKLLDIITDVIEISQIHSKQLDTTFSEMEVISLLKNIAGKFEPRAKEKNLTFELHIKSSEDKFYFSTDGEKLKRILLHLIDNAVKFTHEGSIYIHCTIDNTKIDISVCDTGIGIANEMQEVIFEPFRQVETGIKRVYGGNGLGLTLVKSYTEMLNGSFSLQSELHKGTTVRVSLPVSNLNKPFKKESELSKYTIKTILVAEDEYTNYQYLLEILESRNVKILYASDGQQAVDLCKSNPSIDLVLMDIKMPIMDGQEAARQIKNFRPKLPIIAQTAYALESEKSDFIDDFDDYISKPIKESDLNEKLLKFIPPGNKA